MTRIVHLRRGPVGWFFEIVFYLFNLAMAVAMIYALGRAGDILAAAETELAKGIAGFGAATRVFILTKSSQCVTSRRKCRHNSSIGLSHGL